MSVYTRVSDNEFSEILKNYTLGELVSAQGIRAGIENTNYFLTTSQGDYVFTLFEKISKEEVCFYISLLQQLSAAGIACPQPQADCHQQTVNLIKEKPFTIVTRLKGNNLSVINNKQCKAIATELARLHSASLSMVNPANPLLKNRRGKDWREEKAKRLLRFVSAEEARLISNELSAYQSLDDSALPKGIIHADLFPDNALFENDQLSGIIDFYDACYDNYLYDVAITLNAWCCNEAGEVIKVQADEFLQSYQQIRPFTAEEERAWPLMLRIAAMRFWLSRLNAAFDPDPANSLPGTLTSSKNPDEYRQILENHINSVAK